MGTPNTLEEVSLFHLLARTLRRPSLAGLNNQLFKSGPHPREVIEITGEAGTGKTYIATDLIAKCLLPASCQGSSVGGLQCGVVYLNLDHHFDTFRLTRLMEVRVRRRLNDVTDEQVDELISSSLNRLAMVPVYNQEEFAPALITAQRHIFMTTNVSLVVVDSISAFYWSNVAKGGTRKMDSFVEEMLKYVEQYLSSFPVTFMYTRPSYFYSKSSFPVKLSNSYNLRSLNTRIQLKTHAQRGSARAEVQYCSQTYFLFYEISKNGVTWSK